MKFIQSLVFTILLPVFLSSCSCCFDVFDLEHAVFPNPKDRYVYFTTKDFTLHVKGEDNKIRGYTITVDSSGKDKTLFHQEFNGNPVSTVNLDFLRKEFINYNVINIDLYVLGSDYLTITRKALKHKKRIYARENINFAP